MDTQLTQLKRCNKSKDEIAYPHNGELIIYRKERDESGIITFTEIRVNTETRVTVKRKMRADEMTEAQFDMIKPILDEETRTSFNQDWLETYQNVCFDALEETDLACVPSPEAEMIDELDKREIEETEEHNPLRRTSENGMSILSEILNEKQIEYFIEHHQNELSARKIAEKYGVAHTTVSRALKVIDKKIKKYFQTHGKICSKTPEKSI